MPLPIALPTAGPTGIVEPLEPGVPIYTLYAPDGTVAWRGGVLDEFGVAWVVTAEDGWSGSLAVRRSDSARAGADGEFRGAATFGPRVVTLTGKALAPDRLAMLWAKERLAAAASELSVDAPLVVDEAHLSRQALVSRGDAWKATDDGSTRFDWQVVLKATDPLRYASTPTAAVTTLPTPPGGRSYPRLYPLAWGANPAGGFVSLTNVGSRPVCPVYTITGPVLNPRIVNVTTGETWAIAHDLQSGEWLTVDTFARSVLLNDTANRRPDVRAGSDWPGVPVGDSLWQYRGDTYTASQLTITFRSAWL
jgi:hypothetical protein